MTVDYGPSGGGLSPRRSFAAPSKTGQQNLLSGVALEPPDARRAFVPGPGEARTARLAMSAEVWLGEDLEAVEQPGSDLPRIELKPTGVVPGRYTDVEIDRKGRVVRAWNRSTAVIDSNNVIETFDVVDANEMVYPLLYQPLDDTSRLHINGLQNFEGSDDDYTVASNLITFAAGTPLTVGDRIKVSYQY
jgi:hypothetical protein